MIRASFDDYAFHVFKTAAWDSMMKMAMNEGPDGEVEQTFGRPGETHIYFSDGSRFEIDNGDADEVARECYNEDPSDYKACAEAMFDISRTYAPQSETEE